MFDVASSLMDAAASAREKLADAASETSRAQTPYGAQRTDASMALAAREAIFAEALFNAVHARLAELKVVAHG